MSSNEHEFYREPVLYSFSESPEKYLEILKTIQRKILDEHIPESLSITKKSKVFHTLDFPSKLIDDTFPELLATKTTHTKPAISPCFNAELNRKNITNRESTFVDTYLIKSNVLSLYSQISNDLLSESQIYDFLKVEYYNFMNKTIFDRYVFLANKISARNYSDYSNPSFLIDAISIECFSFWSKTSLPGNFVILSTDLIDVLRKSKKFKEITPKISGTINEVGILKIKTPIGNISIKIFESKYLLDTTVEYTKSTGYFLVGVNGINRNSGIGFFPYIPAVFTQNISKGIEEVVIKSRFKIFEPSDAPNYYTLVRLNH